MIVNTFHFECARVQLGKSVSRAYYNPDQLWERQHKVKDLRDEEQEQRLGEVAEYPNNCKHHSSKISVRITNKHFRRISIILEQCQRRRYKRKN